MDKQYAGSSQAGNASPQAPLNSVFDALKHLQEAVSLARTTADHLCGGQPEAVSSEGRPANASYFGRIEDVASEIHSQAARIAGDMQRIQNRL